MTIFPNIMSRSDLSQGQITLMIVQALATLVLDPVERKIVMTREPKVHFSPTSIKHLTRSYKVIAGLTIAASTTPRSFSHETSEAFILLVDSGSAPVHLLTLILFPLAVRGRVRVEMAAWRAGRQLDETRGGAHWYSIAVLKRFCDGFEYFVDSNGQACGVALESWTESGVEAVFNRAQRTRLGMRRRARCLLLSHDTKHDEAGGRRRHHEMSRDSVSDTEMDGAGGGGGGGGTGWMGEGTLERSLGAVIRSVPSVRSIFQ